LASPLWIENSSSPFLSSSSSGRAQRARLRAWTQQVCAADDVSNFAAQEFGREDIGRTEPPLGKVGAGKQVEIFSQKSFVRIDFL
jgi:hypothetical protein